MGYGKDYDNTSLDPRNILSAMSKSNTTQEDDNSVCSLCKGTGTIRHGKVECPDCGGSGKTADSEKDERQVTKGGPGSGPQSGHDFYGNQYSNNPNPGKDATSRGPIDRHTSLQSFHETMARSHDTAYDALKSVGRQAEADRHASAADAHRAAASSHRDAADPRLASPSRDQTASNASAIANYATDHVRQ